MTMHPSPYKSSAAILASYAPEPSEDDAPYTPRREKTCHVCGTKHHGLTVLCSAECVAKDWGWMRGGAEQVSDEKEVA